MLRVVLVFLSMLLVGCAVTPTPTPASLAYARIGTTPELEAQVISWLREYRDHSDDILQVRSFSAQILLSTVETGETDILISGSTPPDGWFATPMSKQPITVIVNADNTIQSLDLDELQALFSGQTSSWESLTGEADAVQPVVPLQGDSTRIVFQRQVMGGAAFSTSALLAPTPEILLELIHDHSGAIGFIFQSDVDAGVRQIPLKNDSSVDAEEGPDDHPLVVDILAMSPEEPQGIVRDFIVWVQAHSIP